MTIQQNAYLTAILIQYNCTVDSIQFYLGRSHHRHRTELGLSGIVDKKWGICSWSHIAMCPLPTLRHKKNTAKPISFGHFAEPHKGLLLQQKVDYYEILTRFTLPCASNKAAKMGTGSDILGINMTMDALTASWVVRPFSAGPQRWIFFKFRYLRNQTS